jgi:REP element-mobilizing transposase RayT
MKQEKDNVTSQQAAHYLTFNTVDWVDVFVRPAYKQIIATTLNEFIAAKRLTVYAWCLMSNHLHMMVQAKEGVGLALIERDFKKITTSRILDAIDLEADLRRSWMLARFEQISHDLKRIEKYQLWQNSSNPVYVDFKEPYSVEEQLMYIHENPVRDRIVCHGEDYLFSSAKNYSGKKGLVNVTVIDLEGLIRSLLKPNSSK